MLFAFKWTCWFKRESFMQDQNAPIRAAIDIGSNTIHIVVARCTLNDLEILADEEELIRIGESVTATGEISPQKRDAAISTLHQYKALAELHNAKRILVVATEAIRQASNHDAFLASILQATGLEVHLIEGDVEAALTFYGATYELNRELHPPASVGVMDLGGGSMELVLAKNMQISWRTSVPIGSGWLHDRYFHANPPTDDDFAVARTFLQTYFQGMHIKRYPPVLVATGGSANSLLHLARHAFDLASQQSILTIDDLMRCEELLRTLTAEEVAERYFVALERARILPAGVLIISALLLRLKLSAIRVTSHGIREGVLLAYTRYGEQWLQQNKYSIEAAAQGNNGDRVEQRSAKGVQDASFALVGRHMLLERVYKMTEWREEVLKHDDIEAVHKMRVASRRLRAVLDAYASICEPKPFKKAYRRVRELADLLGHARDTDVMIENLRTQMGQMSYEEQPGIQWQIERLSAYRQRCQQELETFLKKFDKDSLQRQVALCLPEGRGCNGKGKSNYSS
jgi:exopolyphosphatase/pppGpp-phosphohydrolase